MSQDLIRRDALPLGTLHGWQYVSKSDLDAAPPIRCRTCRHERIHSAGTPHEYRLCNLGNSCGYDPALPDWFGCVCHEVAE